MFSKIICNITKTQKTNELCFTKLLDFTDYQANSHFLEHACRWIFIK